MQKFSRCVAVGLVVLAGCAAARAATNTNSVILSVAAEDIGSLQRRLLLSYARARMDTNEQQAERVAASLSSGVERCPSPVILALFAYDGRLVCTQRVDEEGVSLVARIDDAVTRLKASAVYDAHRRRMADYSVPDGAFPDYLHLLLVGYTGRFINFGIKGLFDYRIYEPQVTGLAYEWRGRRAELTPVEALAGNLGSRGSRAALASKLGFSPRSMPEQNDLVIEVYRTTHVGEAFPSREATDFFRGHRVFTARDVTYPEIMYRLMMIGRWYRNNVVNGEVTYAYYPSTGHYANDQRTMVRSTMAVWILNRLAVFLDDAELNDLGQQTLEFYLQRYFNISRSIAEGRLAPSTVPSAKGETVSNRWTTAGFLVAAILERGALEDYAQEVRLLMDWAGGFQRPDGVFRTRYAQSQYFMPGQFLLVVASLYRETGEERYRDFFERSYSAYEPSLTAMLDLSDDLTAPLAPAWFTQPLAVMARETGTDRYRDMIFRINDRVARWYDVNRDHQVYPDYDGILAPKTGHYGNTSVSAAALESLADAALVAREAGDDARYRRYTAVIRQAVAHLLRLQYLPENTYYIRNRTRVLGGFKTNLLNTKSWMDNVWHLTSALMKINEHRLLEEP